MTDTTSIAAAGIVPPLEMVVAFLGEGGGTHVFPNHHHDHGELVLYHDATGSIVTPHGALPLRPGTIAYCPPGLDHAVHVDDPAHDACSVIQFRWVGTWPPWLGQPWVTTSGRNGWAAGEVAWLASRRWNRSAALLQEAACRLTSLLVHLHHGSVTDGPVPVRSPSAGIRAIQERIRRDIGSVTVASLARSCGITADHLTRLFRTQFGYTARDAIILARVEAAKPLLENSSLSINDIARRIGYATPQRFCSMFRRMTGMTPNSFRCKAFADSESRDRI